MGSSTEIKISVIQKMLKVGTIEKGKTKHLLYNLPLFNLRHFILRLMDSISSLFACSWYSCVFWTKLDLSSWSKYRELFMVGDSHTTADHAHITLKCVYRFISVPHMTGIRHSCRCSKNGHKNQVTSQWNVWYKLEVVPWQKPPLGNVGMGFHTGFVRQDSWFSSLPHQPQTKPQVEKIIVPIFKKQMKTIG